MIRSVVCSIAFSISLVACEPVVAKMPEMSGMPDAAMAPDMSDASSPDAVGTDAAADAAADAAPPQGAPGTLDPTFGVGGAQVVAIGVGNDTASAMVVQPDGKILVAGSVAENGFDFAIVRFLRDGALDTTFGTGGKVTTDFNGSFDSAYAIALQPDGKIIVAGTSSVSGSSFDFAVARYLPDGTLDPTFSGDGKQTTPVGTGVDFANAVVIEPGGKIVLGGSTGRPPFGADVDFALVRYLSDGSLDASFGSTGIVITPVTTNSVDSISALALQQINGEWCIVAAGTNSDFALARYRANGQLDSTFGTGGLVTGVFQATAAARALAVAPSGELFVAGHVNHDVAVVELSASGAVLAPFGRRIVALSTDNSDEAQAIVLDGDRPLVAGWVNEGTTTAGNFALVRLMPDGTLDSSFAGGKVVTPIGAAGQPDQAYAIALQVGPQATTVRAVVAGYATATTNRDVAVARYWR
jgi:uncharacterized delta-60 repeat protein